MTGDQSEGVTPEPVEATGDVDRCDPGRTPGVNGVAIRVEATLRASEARLRRLADAMPQLVWTAAPDGTVDYYNSRVTEYAGIERSGDGSWTWRSVLHPDDQAMTLRAWRQAVAQGQVYVCEHRVRMADGALRWHLSRAVPVRDDAGRILQWFGTATDIQDLKHVQDVLQESDRRKDELLATLAHELRNLLAPIRTGVEILSQRDTADPVASQARGMIDRQTGHLARLIDDLLDISRIKLGRLSLQRVPIDLVALVSEASAAWQALAGCADRQLELALTSGPLWVSGDAVRLSQVLTNLVDNACKFTSVGGRIRVSAEAEGSTAVLRVSDDGIGISESDPSSLFDLFEQAGAGDGAGQSGLGIGLSLARRLVELHGGRIEACSAGPGRGTVVRVELPLRGPPAALSSHLDECRERPGPPRPRRILVVDDHQGIRDSLALLLRLRGHDIETASDGLEAVEAAARYRPEVILLDIGMPRLDGYGACRRIRQELDGQRPFIIALSGWGQARDREHADAAGFDGHLVKPVDSAALFGLLEALEADRGDAEASGARTPT